MVNSNDYRHINSELRQLIETLNSSIAYYKQRYIKSEVELELAGSDPSDYYAEIKRLNLTTPIINLLQRCAHIPDVNNEAIQLALWYDHVMRMEEGSPHAWIDILFDLGVTIFGTDITPGPLPAAELWLALGHWYYRTGDLNRASLAAQAARLYTAGSGEAARELDVQTLLRQIAMRAHNVKYTDLDQIAQVLLSKAPPAFNSEDMAPDDIEVTVERLLETTPADDLQTQAYAHSLLAYIHLHRRSFRDNPEAFRHAAKALALWEKLGNERQQALAKHYLAEMQLGTGQYVEAVQHIADVRAYAEKIQDQGWLADVTRTFGVLRQQQGKHDTADELFQESLAIYEQEGNGPGKCLTVHSLAVNALTANRLDEAVDYTRRALDGWKQLGKGEFNITDLYYLLGFIYNARHEPENARRAFEATLHWAKKLPDPYRQRMLNNASEELDKLRNN